MQQEHCSMSVVQNLAFQLEISLPKVCALSAHPVMTASNLSSAAWSGVGKCVNMFRAATVTLVRVYRWLPWSLVLSSAEFLTATMSAKPM